MKPRHAGFNLSVAFTLCIAASACAPDSPTGISEDSLDPVVVAANAAACVPVEGLLSATGSPVPAIGLATGDLQGLWVGVAAPAPVGSGEFLTGRVAHLATSSIISVTGGKIPALIGADLIFEGPHDVQIALAPERVHGHWTLVSGARRGHLAINGTAELISPPTTVQFEFGYRGVICP